MLLLLFFDVVDIVVSVIVIDTCVVFVIMVCGANVIECRVALRDIDVAMLVLMTRMRCVYYCCCVCCCCCWCDNG